MRQVRGVYKTPKPHWVGDGFHVRSLFSPGSNGVDLDPFILLDYAAPEHFEPAEAPRGVSVHPHRGFETVTIVYQGELEHRDSTGRGGSIGPGDVQWMTAASGILHEEFHSEAFTKRGGTMEMVQLWVNLPAKFKSAEPGYQTLAKEDIPSVALPKGAGTLRVIAGSYDGITGPARTFTPVNVWDVRLKTGTETTLALPEDHSAAAVVQRGQVRVNGTYNAGAGQLVVFNRKGGDVELAAGDEDTMVLVLTGAPLNEAVVAQGPFVMNTLGEIKQAMLDYQNGAFGRMS